MKKSQNDLRQVVALLDSVPYKRSDDPKNISFLQMSHNRGARLGAGDELTAFGFGGRRPAYGQGFTFGSLCRPRWIGTNRLAEIMGRAHLLRSCDIRHWNRNRTAQHEFRPNRVDCGYSRQSDGNGFATFILSFCLDTTLTLKRRNLCAA